MKIITTILIFVSVLTNAQFNPMKDSLILKEFNALNTIRQTPKQELIKELNRKCENKYQYGYDSVKLKAKYNVNTFAELFEIDSLSAVKPVKLDWDLCKDARDFSYKMNLEYKHSHMARCELLTTSDFNQTGVTTFLTEGDEAYVKKGKKRLHRDELVNSEWTKVGICIVYEYKIYNDSAHVTNRYKATSLTELKNVVVKSGNTFEIIRVTKIVRIIFN